MQKVLRHLHIICCIYLAINFDSVSSAAVADAAPKHQRLVCFCSSSSLLCTLKQPHSLNSTLYLFMAHLIFDDTSELRLVFPSPPLLISFITERSVYHCHSVLFDSSGFFSYFSFSCCPGGLYATSTCTSKSWRPVPHSSLTWPTAA